jgi:Mg-chelatase subunit ChlD
MLLSLLLPLAPLVCPVPQDLPIAEALGTWYKRWDRRRSMGPPDEAQYGALLAQASVELQRDHAGLAAVTPVLMDLASWGLTRPPRRADYLGGADRQRVRRGARDVLDDVLDGTWRPVLLSWMADEVLVRSKAPLPRRLLALEVGLAQRATPTKMALLTVARDEADPLWPWVVDALVSWPDEAVDSYLVGRLGRKFERGSSRHPYTLLLRRIQESELPLGSRATDVLVGRLKVSLLSTDWREASRAIEVTRGLASERGVPLLLDALSAWTRREQRGGGSRRILDDVVRELRRISGKSIGRNPRNWITWWVAVRQGRAELAGEGPQDDEPKTEATFFGLRPMTDQVTFVIDTSGSMDAEWGTTEHSRYVEAVDQMMRFLQAAGPMTRFNVILFSDEPLRSSPHLVRATARNLAKARESLLGRSPGGGTFLRPAFELALRLDSEGNVDPQRLEADTIVVLCDGETGEGKGWVAPLLERVQDAARIRVHCVLVGVKGDGTLEALAEGTGGDFLRIGG